MHNTFSSRPKVRSLPTDALEKVLAFAKEIGAKATLLTVVESPVSFPRISISWSPRAKNMTGTASKRQTGS
jgi:hypothetical protein